MKSKHALEAPLRAVRARMRHVQRTRGLMIFATVAIGGLLALMALDFVLSPLPVALRWAMTGAWGIGVLAAIKSGFAPLLRPIGLLQVARWLEERHPEMEERLSTVLEISGNEKISPGLLDSLTRAAELDAGAVNAALEVKSARTTRRWARPALALLALMALAFAVWPGEASRLLVRAVAPFSDVGNSAAGRFQIRPGNLELLAGDAVTVEAGYRGGAKSLEISLELPDGKTVSQPMTGTGSYTMDPVRSSFRYRVVAGREESDIFKITAWPRPALIEPRATLDFPSYTGVPSKEIEVDRGITAVAGTRVTLSAELNTPVEAAWLKMARKRLTAEISAAGGRISISWLLGDGGSGETVVMLKHRLGREIEALRFPVNVTGDMPPEVVLLSPLQHDLKVRPDEILTMRYNATDDFALAKIAVEVDAGGNAKVQLDQSLPPKIGATLPAQHRGNSEISVGALRKQFPEIREVRLRIRAEDGRPQEIGGPGVGFSEWLTLRIDEGAESLARQDLRQQDEGARRTVEEAMRAANEARQRMDWHRGEIKKPDLNDNALKDLKEAAERLAEAQRKLAELAQQMEESVHAGKAEEIAKAAELAAKAREDLENSLLQDDPAQRETQLDQARNEAQETEKQLEQIRNEMDRDRQKIEDLARLMDLAQKQKELARQANENLLEPETNREDWKNRQRQVEEALKQQLRERPESQSGALTAQAEKAKALAEEARQTAADQRAMEKQETSPEQLREALAKEQSEIAEAAHAEVRQAQEAQNVIADQLPAATAAADAAKEQLEKGEIQAAAKAAKEAAAGLKQAATDLPAESAAQAESLTELAERQEKLSEALDSLAAGEAAAAAEKLAESRAEDAAGLAAEIERMPQIQGNGAMNDARNAGKQGAGKARAAAEAVADAAARQHGESRKNFEQAAQALDRAAEDFSRAAQETAGRPPDAQKALADASALATAFQQSSMAASEPMPAAAAEQAAAAADALAQAAKSEPGKPMPGMPGEKPDDGPHLPEPDAGVPPELARLGISSEDWVKIQASLKSDVGAADPAGVPVEYRGLVKSYFESMSKASNDR